VCITDQVKSEVMLLSGQFMAQAEDRYNFWDEHIKYVVREALILAKKYDADAEIVELAATMHDVALIAKAGTRGDHHITGAEMAEAILQKYNYPQEKIEKVKKCVLNHRSGKNATDIEALCVADADILAHFDNVPMLLNRFFIGNDISNMTLPALRSKLKAFFDHDYNDLSERTRQEFGGRYALICRIVLGQ